MISDWLDAGLRRHDDGDWLDAGLRRHDDGAG